ncbi:MAG: glycosyltransferase family 9 protein, partial [Bacteroidetes bacterium]|nr:glycosyltransferase family 9 protein [Bacteroidota bacterium]
KNHIELIVYFVLRISLPKSKMQNHTLLLINTGFIGDLVVSTVLIENQDIFSNYEKVQFLIKEQYLDLFSNYEGKIEFIGYNYKKYKFSLIYKFEFLSKLRREGFEKCIHLTAARGILNEEITHLVGAKEVITLNSFWEYLGKNLGKYFDGKYSKIVANNTLNEYEKHSELLQYLGGDGYKNIFNKGITFNEENIDKIEKHIDFTDAIVIAPFSSLMNREWKKEYYFEVVCKLKDIYQVVLIGTKNQKKDLEELKNRDENVWVLAGELKLHEIPILLKRARLFIGQDSGLTHIALKMGTPLIALIGGGEFGRFFPFMESEKVKYLYSQMDCFLCHWVCRKEEMFCMTDITPKILLDEVEKVIRVGNDN